MKISIAEQKIPMLFLLLALTATGENVEASACGVMKLQENKSTAVMVNHNSCQEKNNIAIGTVITMQPGSRLWLKSNPEVLSESRFQIICQNMSMKKIDASVAGLFPPWFRVAQPNSCSGWVDGKLMCRDPVSTQKSFFCALAYEGYRGKKEDAFDRSTSVKIRSLDSLNQADEVDDSSHRFDDYILEIKRDIALCKRVYPQSDSIKFTWQVKLVGLKQAVDILYPIEQKGGFFDCAKAVLESFPYSLHSEVLKFEAQF